MTARRRVAVWRDSFAPYSETFIWDEVRSHRRWAATVFAPRRINADRFPWPDVVSLPLPAQVAYFATGRSRRFARALRAGAFELVHAHFGTAGVYALPFARACGLPLITSFHGADVTKLVGPRSRRVHNLPFAARARALFRGSARVLAASEELRDALIAGGCPRDRLTVFRLGVDLARFPASRGGGGGAPHVVMIGRLVAKKGFEPALRALGELRDLRPRVTVAGDGPLRRHLQRVARDAGVNARFAGALPHAAVAALLAEADLLLAPSELTADGDRDSGLIVVKEAGAAGVPAVATAHGGIPEIIDDGVTGYLVPERDRAALAARARALLTDNALRARMGAAARAKIAREYDLAARVRALEALYDELAPPRAAAP